MKKNTLRKFSPRGKLLAPSLLASNFAKLGNEVQEIDQAGADILHIDIMDGHFVPNLSMGPSIVKAIRPLTKLPFDVHLMVSRPADFINHFCEAGADHITVHVEAKDDIKRTLQQIRFLGCSVGLSIKPETTSESVLPYLSLVDMILVMTVEPGFGGQKFLPSVVEKIKTIRDWIDKGNHSIHLEVDGGITYETASVSIKAGVNILVAGTTIFKSKDGLKGAVERLKSIMEQGKNC